MKKWLGIIALLLLLILICPVHEARAEWKNGDLCPGCKQFTLVVAYSDKNIHYLFCGSCDYFEKNFIFFPVENHYGGTATCTNGPICRGCGHEYGDSLGYSDHDWDKWESGVTEPIHMRECKVCHTVETENCDLSPYYFYNIVYHLRECSICENLIFDSHSGGKATCTKGPICDVCHGEYGDSLGYSDHNWATILTKGDTTHYYACFRCDARKDEAEHAYENWVYVDSSNHKGVCQCGAETAPVSHTGGTATCQAKAKCTACGEDYGDYADHEWDTAWTAGNGKHWHKCKTPGCTATTDKVDHSGGTATCQAKAKCTVCGEEYGELLAHDLVNHAAQAPTCTAVGWGAYDTCSCCDYTTYVEKAKLGHDLVHHDAQAPTCTTVGWDAYDTCSRCDYTTYSEKPAKGHTEVKDKTVEATCTKTGLTEGKHCSACNEVLVKQETVPAKGHTEVKDEAVPATIEKTGLTEGSHCSVCGEVLKAQEIIPKLPEPAEEPEPPHVHTPVTDARVEPTCTKAGLMEGKHCSECGEVLEAQEEIPMTGHWFDNWVPDDEGSHRANCRRCRFTGSMPCVMFVLPREEGAEGISFCPVCGYCAGAEDMTASEDMALIGGAPKSANLKVFLLETGEDKYLVLAFEHHGELVQPEGKVSFAPMEALAETSFAQVGTDGTETPAEMTVSEYGLTLTLDFTPEGEDPVPVMILKIS